MDRLLLFDIDRTLLKNAKGHRDAFTHAFKEVYDIDTTIDIINFNGMTDQQIIIEVLQKNNLSEEDIKTKIKDCMTSMIEYYDNIKNNCDPPTILAGVKKLLKELDKQNYLIGLVTGNLEPIARGKLERVKLNQFFKLGGFGSDDINRTNLVKLAIKKAEENFDFKFDKNVFLFGDAPQDMNAGNEAGIITIGVTTGIYSKEQLENAAANYVIDNLKNTRKILNIVLKKAS
ncbi:MAG: HAD hydrolase-like protein [Nanoarchaeota archaeon]|nr:HAD hydrolase-like protein [Nanoarchaeota archaeon]MBU1269760.1 HAD hydrolase-like protein [Nanoarchaeota archaeon]MBU1604352.1 HAD hydrolase-like protein [Nanoarchaeota archaeon]MBU2443392.1 HAD hydrolase-like protein [Nanoarchaeota archaeon]